MKNVLFLGSLVPNEVEQKSQYISSAANRFQNNFVRYLKKEVLISICSYVCTPYEDIHGSSKGQDEEYDCIVKKRSKLLVCVRFFRTVKEKIKDYNNVIVYNVDYITLFVPYLAKNKKKKSILILADYSEEDCYEKWIRRLYARFQKRVIKKYDVVIGLSENVNRFVDINQEFILMEGGIDSAFYDYFDVEKTVSAEKVRVMYSGVLENVTGVDLLLDAIRIVQSSNLEFVFTGKGSQSEQVERVVYEDDRVKYMGSLPYDVYMEQLGMADILVNPRNMNLLENQNNFPSKIMEYLATGKRIVSTRFIGWEKYSEIIDFVESDAVEIGQKIVDISNNYISAYNSIRDYARNKLWENQIVRVINILK